MHSASCSLATRATLKQVGFVSTTDLPSPRECFWEINTLASKEAIAAARIEVRTMLTAGLDQTSPRLEEGLDRTYRRK